LSERIAAPDVPWTVQALPTIVPITHAAATIAESSFALPKAPLAEIALQPGDYERLHGDPPIRLYVCASPLQSPAVLLPLDRLFDIRCAAALQLWRLISGKPPGKGPKALTAQHRARLLLALRALDAHRQHASYRDIAKGLFHIDAMTARNWETHDVRDRTIRVVRLGIRLMEGDYRNLLLYPFRNRI
jgi:hypothetical protein